MFIGMRRNVFKCAREEKEQQKKVEQILWKLFALNQHEKLTTLRHIKCLLIWATILQAQYKSA
jgi:hypothetical protein